MSVNKVTIIGAGKVGGALAKSLKQAGCTIGQVWSNTFENAEQLAGIVSASAVNKLEELEGGDNLYVIAVKDDHIAEVASKLNIGNKLLVHTSGIASLGSLKSGSERVGVLYPIHSFTENENTGLDNAIVLIEAEQDNDLVDLKEIVNLINGKAMVVEQDARQTLHLCAVFCNNFPNHLLAIAERILKDKGLELSILQPLIKETYNKIEQTQPLQAQTGPAKRGDIKTIEKHLERLEDYPEIQNIYKLLTESIQKMS